MEQEKQSVMRPTQCDKVPAVKMRNITKAFGSVLANDRVWGVARLATPTSWFLHDTIHRTARLRGLREAKSLPYKRKCFSMIRMDT